ncbi:MAG: GNAT family N-acetyltransferase/peptidase C39 family protein [Kiritimatiellia bacterium]|nr:GNAT family N-acetyltransferase/peptidase C39 family protein [Kiritimatiellia bacterium]
MIRPATARDLAAMVSLEQRCFEMDRISPRQFRYLVRRGRASILVAEREGRVVGTAVTLFRKGVSLARLYSIAVDTAARGCGVGRDLLDTAEREARRRGCVYMRSEIRPDNRASIGLFESLGYRRFGLYPDYYEDHSQALRFEKRLVQRREFRGIRVPYYRQTLDFTCGSASVLMAMKAIDPGFRADRSMEIRVWREATTVFMTAGHGGCGPYGLALAAQNRGFDTAVYISRPSGLFVDSDRDEEKKAVIRLVEDDFRKEVRSAGIPVLTRKLTAELLTEALDAGRIPVVLISSYRLYEETFPHWVVVTGSDETFFYLHDPYVDTERGRTETDCMDLPVSKLEFERMTRYGRDDLQAALLIGPRTDQRNRGG